MNTLKKVPKSVLQWFEKNYPPKKGFTYSFYSYSKDNRKPRKGDNKIYGCLVMKHNKLYHSGTQANEKWFEHNVSGIIKNKKSK